MKLHREPETFRPSLISDRFSPASPDWCTDWFIDWCTDWLILDWWTCGRSPSAALPEWWTSGRCCTVSLRPSSTRCPAPTLPGRRSRAEPRSPETPSDWTGASWTTHLQERREAVEPLKKKRTAPLKELHRRSISIEPFCVISTFTFNIEVFLMQTLVLTFEWRTST